MKKTVHRVVMALALLGWMTSVNVFAGPIIEGREWYQPNQLSGYSWNQFDTTCPAAACSGLLGGVGPDLSGWTWASIYDVGELFAATTAFPGGIGQLSDTSISPAIDFFTNTGFEITTGPEVAINFGISAVVGLSSTLLSNGSSAYVGAVQLGLFAPYARGTRIFTNSTAPDLNQPEDYLGAWLYRPAEVSEPGTLPLFIAALTLWGWVQRKRVV